MPNHQKHRGQQSDDFKIFGDTWLPILRQAVKDLSYLMTEDYPESAAVKLVGDRYRLNERQRTAVLRSACSHEAFIIRQKKLFDSHFLKNEKIFIDTYNLLITIESALSNGIILVCRDGCYRDLASVHGTYKRVEETLPAIHLIGEALQELGIKEARWYLDSPVSNSGRLKGFILHEALENQWNWSAELVLNPDKILVEANQIVVSSDSWVIENASAWFNLSAYIIEYKIHKANLKFLI